MKQGSVHSEAAAPLEPARLAANEEVLGLGFEWISHRLAGGDCAEARQAYDEARERLRAAGTPAAIDRIASSFMLAPFDEDVLLIVLAPEIDGSLGSRYGAAQGRLTPSPATPYLIALLLFAADRLPSAAQVRLARSAVLRRYELVSVDETVDLPMSASMTLPERVRDFLCGIESADPLLEQRVRVLDGAPLNDCLDMLASKTVGLLSRSTRVQLIGPARSGRRAVAAAALDRLGLGAVAVCADQRLEALAGVLARDSVLDSFGVVIEPAEGTDQSVLRLLAQRIAAPMLVISDTPLEGLEEVPIVRLAPLESTDRAAIWRQCAPDCESEDVVQVAEQFALGPSEISALASQAEMAGAGLWRTCSALGNPDLETLATRVVPKRSWDDMVLADETRSELRALADQIGSRPLVHGEWGYSRILGRATGVSALFAGPSGVGKTLAAEVIAHALKLDLYLVDLARVTSKYIGETEKNLRRIFEAAESSGAVLFFDEADALFGKRSEIKDSHDRYANGDISYLLQRMETYSGLAILATNLKSHLDAAFLRRLRLVIDFAQPTSDQRLQLWKKAIPGTAPQDEIDWPWLARIELTGGNITTSAANAAFRAAAEKSPIGMVHLRAALKAELRKLDREPLEACS